MRLKDIANSLYATHSVGTKCGIKYLIACKIVNKDDPEAPLTDAQYEYLSYRLSGFDEKAEKHGLRCPIGAKLEIIEDEKNTYVVFSQLDFYPVFTSTQEAKKRKKYYSKASDYLTDCFAMAMEGVLGIDFGDINTRCYEDIPAIKTAYRERKTALPETVVDTESVDMCGILNASPVEKSF